MQQRLAATAKHRCRRRQPTHTFSLQIGAGQHTQRPGVRPRSFAINRHDLRERMPRPHEDRMCATCSKRIIGEASGAAHERVIFNAH